MFADLLGQYETMEPAGADTWSPLRNELELWHRARLLVELASALNALPRAIGRRVAKGARTSPWTALLPRNPRGGAFWTQMVI